MKITLARLVVFVLIVWVVAPVLLAFCLPDMASRGQFGDLFGSVNALFSGLAFSGLFWSLHLQREQLSLQQKELSLQREELRLQREEMKASRGELANQAIAQMALVKATIAQIVVAKAQAQVEAMKMDSELSHPTQRKAFVEKIEKTAEALGGLADKLEHDLAHANGPS
jgi:hypothetical protein